MLFEILVVGLKFISLYLSSGAYLSFVLLQVKAFSKSLESFKTSIVVGGTNIADQVTHMSY